MSDEGRRPWEDDDDGPSGPGLASASAAGEGEGVVEGNAEDAAAAFGGDERPPEAPGGAEDGEDEPEASVAGPFGARKGGSGPRAHQVTINEAIEEAESRDEGPGAAPLPRRGVMRADRPRPGARAGANALADAFAANLRGPGGDDGWGKPAEFESAERINVGERGLEVHPALRMLSDGLTMLAVAKAPTSHFREGGLGSELLKGMGNKMDEVAPGEALRVDPHDAAKRTPAIQVEPPTRVTKRPVQRAPLPPRFAAEDLDALVPEVGEEAPKVLTVPTNIPEPRLPAPDLDPVSDLLGEAGFVAAPPAGGEGGERAPDGPASQAGMLFHRKGTGGEKGSPKGEESGNSKKAGGSASAAPAPKAKAPGAVTSGGGLGLKHVLLAAGASAALVWVLGGRSGARQDAVVVYAMEERERGLAYLDREIQALEGQVAATEIELGKATASLGATPTEAELAKVENLGRERNREMIALEALRNRRTYLLGGSRGK